MYRFSDSGELNAADAERVLSDKVALAQYLQSGRLDQPLLLLNAPQPVISRDDIDERVVGEVSAQITFSETGDAIKVSILRSNKESLSSAVTEALSKWRIGPATRGGLPTKVIVRQTFEFKVER